MRDRLIAFSRIVGAHVPDATAMAVFMLALLFAAALVAGHAPTEALDAFYRGLWMLLSFSMQVVLMLALSGVLSGLPIFRRVSARVASIPRTPFQVVLGTVLATAAIGYLYWGFAIAMGPLIAVHFARQAELKGVRVDFPCLLATQFAAGSVWQFGPSSPGALLVATPGHFLEGSIGVLPLSATIGSSPAICLVVAFPLVLAAFAHWLMPRDVRPLSAYPAALAFVEPPAAGSGAPSGASGLAAWSERSRALPLLLCALLGGWLWHHFAVRDAALDLNAMVTVLLIATLLATGSIAAFTRALQDAVPSTWQVLVLYQLYGAVAGLLQYTSLGERIAKFFAEVSSPATFPLLTAAAGTAVALFVPSSGGQWIVQGFVTTEAAAGVGASPALGLLALGVGDQAGNLLAPFWMIVVAGIARVDFRTFFGYSLVYAGLWFAMGVTIFTLVPI